MKTTTLKKLFILLFVMIIYHHSFSQGTTTSTSSGVNNANEKKEQNLNTNKDKKKKRFIIDTDTATDDAVALIMAFNHPDIVVDALTIVAGNVPLEQGIQNAMYILTLCKGYVPVFSGMEKPLLRTLVTAVEVHGNDGMSDIGLPLRGFVPQRKHAVLELVERINKGKTEITLVCLGPLTNIAMALLLDKTIAQKVKNCVIMGGVGLGEGNVTPLSEYNFWADPEAAKIVFESGMPIKMVGWDVSRAYAVFDDEDALKLKSMATPLSHIVGEILKPRVEQAKKVFHLKGFSLPDPIAMAIAIDSSVAIETKKAFVSILTNEDDSRGQSAIDYMGTTGKKVNAEIVWKADSEKFKQMLRDACKAK